MGQVPQNFRTDGRVGSCPCCCRRANTGQPPKGTISYEWPLLSGNGAFPKKAGRENRPSCDPLGKQKPSSLWQACISLQANWQTMECCISLPHPIPQPTPPKPSLGLNDLTLSRELSLSARGMALSSLAVASHTALDLRAGLSQSTWRAGASWRECIF